MKKRISIFRKEHFNAAHRLYRKDWTDEKNEEVFGLCANPNWHGHNYDLIVRVTGDIDPVTGFVINLDTLKAIIHNEVIDRFDHRNLNEDLPQFRDTNPTVENIAVVIYDLLRAALGKEFDLHIRLYETPRNFVEYPSA